jgi:hypothetical protein
MDEHEKQTWTAVYAATVGGLMAGRDGIHFISPHRTPSMDGTPYIETVSTAARTYADRAVADLRRVTKKDPAR